MSVFGKGSSSERCQTVCCLHSLGYHTEAVLNTKWTTFNFKGKTNAMISKPLDVSLHTGKTFFFFIAIIAENGKKKSRGNGIYTVKRQIISNNNFPHWKENRLWDNSYSLHYSGCLVVTRLHLPFPHRYTQTEANAHLLQLFMHPLTCRHLCLSLSNTHKLLFFYHYCAHVQWQACVCSL